MCGIGMNIASSAMPIPFMKKASMNMIAKITPPFMKDFNDKVMPDSVRKSIIKEGGGKMLNNPDSEATQAANEQANATIKQNQANAFAAQYNNQARFV